MIDDIWENAQSYLFLNPTYSQKEQERFYQILEAAHAFPNHIWLSTSGSSVQKWVGLSKSALLASAQAVNAHLQSTAEDIWVNPLPFFHVGGLGIWARAYLSGAQVYDFKQEHPGKWQPEKFFHSIHQKKGTLTALVPAQLHDMIACGYRSPPSLRAVIIGGGVLLPILYEKAVTLGWPLLPSYGLTECASQVATARLGSWQHQQLPALEILPHVQIKVQEECLCFSGSALLSAYAYSSEEGVAFVDPKFEGWWMSEDRGEIDNGELTVFGRRDAMIKVGGENVDLARLESHLQAMRMQLNVEADVTLVSFPDARLGHCVHLVTDSQNRGEIYSLLAEFQKTLLPFEKVRDMHFVHRIPRSPLGKILNKELFEEMND